MKIFIICLLCLPVIATAQTTQLNFTYKNGATYGRWQVMDLPTTLFSPGVPQGQLLIFYPPAYKAGKLCGFLGFLPGDGENNSLNVTQCTVNSLARMVQAGATPYSLLPNKDTLWWVVVCIHNNSGSAYRTQLKQILPWIWDKSGIRYDPAHVGITGLSGGGSATWASVMIDTAMARRINWIVPMANGGYDDNLSKLMFNLVQACKIGVNFWPYIGTQDPGYNAVGFFAYDAVLKNYVLPDHYHPHVIQGGRHDASTWDIPWNSRTVWDSLGWIGTGTTVPPTNPLHARIWADSLIIHYPTTSVTLRDSSTGIHNFVSWGATAFPTGYRGKWSSGQFPTDMLFANLVEGVYQAQLIVADEIGHSDTAQLNIRVYGPEACPPPRRVIGIQVPVFGVLVPIPVDQAILQYNDGNP